MQTEVRRSPLMRSFFSSLDKKDLLASTVFALLTFVLSLFYPCSSTGTYESTITNLFTQLIVFPIQFYGLFFAYFTLEYPVIYWPIIILAYIPSFIFKLVIFYSLAQYTKKNLGPKDTLLSRNLPSLFTFIYLAIFFVLFIKPYCR